MSTQPIVPRSSRLFDKVRHARVSGPGNRLPAGVARVLLAVSCLVASVLVAGAVPSSASTPPTPGAFGGFSIDGVVPDSGAGQYSDPHGSDKELGPKNASNTKVGPVHGASPAMLDFTNPNAQTDLNTVWMNTGKDTVGNTWLYFGWARDANSGSGQVMFEFDRNARPVACDYDGVSQTEPVTPGAQALIDTCNPWANRAAGDFVIVWDWSGGSTTIVKRTFVTSGAGLSLGTGVTLSAADAKAAYSADLFRGEAAINLTTTVFPAVPTSCFTIANVIPGTVTGNSDTADYKDIVLNGFADQYISNCGSVKVTKATNPGGQSGSFPVGLSRTGNEDINFAAAKSASRTLTGDNDTKTFDDILPGSNYQLAETVPAGWDLVSITCGGNDVTNGTFTVVAGAQVACTVTNLKRAPALSLTKSASPTTYDSVGDVISYSYVVQNTGNVTLAGPVTVADNKVTVTCPALPVGGLLVGATTTCTASHTITQADLDSGSITNLAKASANGTDSNQDSKTVTAVQTKTLSLDKTASPATYSAVGNVISYSYAVTNTGNVTLAGPVTVADNKVSVTCPVGGLAPGASMTCTASHTITQADLDAGLVTNLAKASANGIDSNPDTETVTASQGRTLSLDKTAAPKTYNAVGDVISYSYKVTNTGNVTLAGPVTVADDKATVTCPAGGLAPGAFTTCTASYTVTQADLDSGLVTNLAKATVAGIDSNPDTETVTAVQRRSMLLAKSASPTTYDAVNQSISYSYKVTNTGNVTLAGPVTVTDDKATVTCPAGGLAPGAFTTCTSSYSITQHDLDFGAVTNVATASANGVTSNQDTATVKAVAKPALSIDKTATPASYNKVGDVISYKYVVTNTGNVTLAGPITVVDDKVDTACPSGSLAPAASLTCTASYTIKLADLDAGSVKNVAYAQSGTTKSAPDDVTVNGQQTRSLSIDKTATETSYTSAGTVLHYSYKVTNTGNVTLSAITVTDDKTPVSCPPTALAPGASLTCTATYTVTQADVDHGSVKNTAYASSGATQSAPDSVTIPVLLPPPPPVVTSADLSIDKVGPTTAVKPGDNVPYTLTVKNIGNGTASNVQVNDTLPAAMTLVSASGTGFTCSGTSSLTCSLAGSLAPGASAVVNVVTKLASDYSSTAIANTAVVLPTDSNPANNTDTETTAVTLPTPPVDQDLGVSKTGLQASVVPGDVLSWTVTVTNVKGTPAAGFSVTDVVPAGLNLLSAGAADWSCVTTGQTVKCTYTGAPLPVGSTASFQIDSLVGFDYQSSTISNTVVVDPGGVDASNDSATAVTPVIFTGGGGGPVVVPTPTASPKPTPSGGGQALPFTGSYTDRVLSGGVLLLLAGLVLALVGRRRRTS